MRSDSVGEQGCLPFDVECVEVKPRTRRTREAAGLLVHRMADDSLAERGWPTGTEVVVDPARRSRRGEMVLACDGGLLRVGVLALELGRPALRTDAGVHWLSAGVEFLGVVVDAESPLAGMPAPSGSGSSAVR